MIFKLSIISILAVATSCTSINPSPWYSKDVTYSFVDSPYMLRGIEISPVGTNMKGVSKERSRELIRKAAAVWSSISGLNLIEVEDGKSLIRIGEGAISGSIAGYGFHPSSAPSGGDMYFDSTNRKWSESMLYKVALHELGHTVGLPHIMHRGSIMYYAITRVSKPSSFDKANLIELYGNKRR